MADIQTALATRTLIPDNALIAGNSVADSDFVFTIGGIRDDGLAATGTIVDASYGLVRLNAQRHLMNQIFGDDGGTPTAITVNASGELVVASTTAYAEDTGHTSGDMGNFILSVRNDAGTSLVDADGDYAPLQVDALGALRVSGDFSSNSEYPEDSVHTSGDIGTFVLSVRNDAGDALAADGDYSPLQVDSTGALRIAGTFSSNSEYPEDSVHTSGDIGTFILSVRNDAGDALAADGDYSPLQVDSTGALRVAASFTSNSEYERDSVAGTTDTGTFMLVVRDDGFVSPVSAAGDYAPLLTDSIGALKVSQNPSLDGALLEYTTASIASNTTSAGFASITATSGDLYVHSVISSSSAPGKVEIENNNTAVAVGFWSASTMMTQMDFPKPIIVSSGDVLDLNITNRNGGGPAADFYTTVIATQA